MSQVCLWTCFFYCFVLFCFWCRSAAAPDARTAVEFGAVLNFVLCAGGKFQVSSLREEIRRALREREGDVTVIDNSSGRCFVVVFLSPAYL